jgi:hypothetical protein
MITFSTRIQSLKNKKNKLKKRIFLKNIPDYNCKNHIPKEQNPPTTKPEQVRLEF